MALLKSIALQHEEELSRLRAEEADACYAIIDGWNKKVPIRSIQMEPPPGKVTEDVAPFKYHYGNLPSRNASRQKRWSEL